MSKNKFVLNKAGVRELLKSQEMKGVLSEYAKTIADKCGDGYEQDVYDGKNRANAMVWASSGKAKRDNNQNNTLLKAVKG